MTSNKPYLLRAFYEWLLDNQLTPHIVVDATVEGTLVPQEHVRDGQIVLNIAPHACGKLQLGNLDLTLDARFGGTPKHLEIPMQAVMAIYARENGAGTIFTPEDEPEDTPPETPSPGTRPAEPRPPKGKPSLKVVK
ncbi:ClpXP protease specificity-enhancing factor [Aliiglaciecola sp. CAU 1673]|uniref:ClpXP protease specificity-enhancing factor n=1 Tax=Aliiglaciecola sp. CAU 1673 TaxID=3032595 RepID=UPI0023DB6DD3|nr:ClpXP protease specificity-enhancing factor [Aliiglaciecola sp. CAU 1673]MDF2178453.1 ClpXP protease specificity-enhancing factor [Aliiglaciecola sp. CAU 1673]